MAIMYGGKQITGVAVNGAKITDVLFDGEEYLKPRVPMTVSPTTITPTYLDNIKVKVLNAIGDITAKTANDDIAVADVLSSSLIQIIRIGSGHVTVTVTDSTGQTAVVSVE